jgi:Carboxypeptidase regulatory-like domain/TonB-dependent Receptor Plug Domain
LPRAGWNDLRLLNLRAPLGLSGGGANFWSASSIDKRGACRHDAAEPAFSQEAHVNSRIRWLGLAVMLASAPAALAQTAVRYSVTGTITGMDGAALAEAEITIVSGRLDSLRMRSDTAGHFSAAGLSAAAVTVNVRRLGYQPKSVNVVLRESGSPAVVIALEPNPAELGTVKIREISEEPDARLRDFYSRKATNNFGRYIEGSEIEKRHPQFISEMMRTVPGASLSASGRVGNTLRFRGCAPLVWIDGVRIPNSQIDEVVTPSDVAGLEVYSSFAGIPAQYFDRTATCGTILVWSRSK